MEMRLFRQTLPETGRDPIFQEFGTWIRHTKIYRKALPEMSDDVIADYLHMVIQRCSSYTTWVNSKYFVGDDYEEVTSPVDNVSLASNAFVVDGSDEALQGDFQNSHNLGLLLCKALGRVFLPLTLCFLEPYCLQQLGCVCRDAREMPRDASDYTYTCFAMKVQSI